jgi:hypothetical protein
MAPAGDVRGGAAAICWQYCRAGFSQKPAHVGRHQRNRSFHFFFPTSGESLAKK